MFQDIYYGGKIKLPKNRKHEGENQPVHLMNFGLVLLWTWVENYSVGNSLDLHTGSTVEHLSVMADLVTYIKVDRYLIYCGL